MQVFIIGSPLETAMVLDRRRLNKQIIECGQILNAIFGKTNAWANHPCTLQYHKHKQWLYEYLQCLEQFIKGNINTAQIYSDIAQKIRPDFHTDEYLSQMKRRLYAKDKEYYSQFAHLGESHVNWYFVDGDWRKYINGKRIN